mmetsp:Transcript_9834/g.27985  ORF Transcript_9834/g.27985 Transcript_9834/m.27985 type:complete len:248 (-) Transcript_9834:482-1225(-)
MDRRGDESSDSSGNGSDHARVGLLVNVLVQRKRAVDDHVAPGLDHVDVSVRRLRYLPGRIAQCVHRVAQQAPASRTQTSGELPDSKCERTLEESNGRFREKVPHPGAQVLDEAKRVSQDVGRPENLNRFLEEGFDVMLAQQPLQRSLVNEGVVQLKAGQQHLHPLKLSECERVKQLGVDPLWVLREGEGLSGRQSCCRETDGDVNRGYLDAFEMQPVTRTLLLLAIHGAGRADAGQRRGLLHPRQDL